MPDAAPLRRHDLADPAARSPRARSAPARRPRPPTASASAVTSSSTRCIPGADELDDAELLRAAHDYRYGFLVAPQPVSFDPPLKIDGDVVFSCLKGADDGDGLIFRCFNPTAAPASVRIAGDFTPSRTRFDETEIEIETGLAVAPGEVATFRLRPHPA